MVASPIRYLWEKEEEEKIDLAEAIVIDGTDLALQMVPDSAGDMHVLHDALDEHPAPRHVNDAPVNGSRVADDGDELKGAGGILTAADASGEDNESAFLVVSMPEEGSGPTPNVDDDPKLLPTPHEDDSPASEAVVAQHQVEAEVDAPEVAQTIPEPLPAEIILPETVMVSDMAKNNHGQTTAGDEALNKRVAAASLFRSCDCFTLLGLDAYVFRFACFVDVLLCIALAITICYSVFLAFSGVASPKLFTSYTRPRRICQHGGIIGGKWLIGPYNIVSTVCIVLFLSNIRRYENRTFVRQFIPLLVDCLCFMVTYTSLLLFRSICLERVAMPGYGWASTGSG